MKVAVAVVVMIGCGGGGGGGPIAREDYPRALATAACAKYYGCCNAEELAVVEMEGGFSDEAACVDRYAEVYASRAPYSLASTVLDPEIAGECRDQIATASCFDFFANNDLVTPSCNREYTGTIADGAPCTTSVECESGRCGVTDNTCETVPGEGEACERACADGLHCFDGICEAKRENGEACESDLECVHGACDGTCRNPPPDTGFCDGTRQRVSMKP